MSALFGLQLEDVFTLEGDGAFGDFEVRMPDQDGGESALPRAVGPHYSVYLALAYGEVNSLEYLFISNRCVEVLYLKHIYIFLMLG